VILKDFMNEDDNGLVGLVYSHHQAGLSARINEL